MSLRIIKAGLLETVQDLGRYGYQHLGINPGGAMDRYAVRIANCLVGNDKKEAVIEMNFPAPVILFEKEALIAISGADLSPTLNGEPIPILHPVFVSKNSILQFQKKVEGSRCYLAVHCGLDLPEWLGSYSTHLAAGVGGVNGRALRKDDVIPFKKDIRCTKHVQAMKGFNVLPWKADVNVQFSISEEIQLLPGAQWESLKPKSQDAFLNNSFQVTPAADRMGYRLKGPELKTNLKNEIVSTAVNFGTLQLLPGGQLIILMADHQTTGGYPRIGHVITAHHHRLAQLGPGDEMKFTLTDLKQAENELMKQEKHLSQLEYGCQFKLSEVLSPGFEIRG